VRHQAAINRQPDEVDRRVALNRERRRRGIYGKGGPDISHTSSGGTTLEAPSTNRARNGAGGKPRLRQDSPEGAKGKPCGASHIAKGYKCGKGAGTTTNNAGLTAAKIALVAGAIAGGAYALSRREPEAQSSDLGAGIHHNKTSRTTYAGIVNTSGPNSRNVNRAIVKSIVSPDTPFDQKSFAAAHAYQISTAAQSHSSSEMAGLVRTLIADDRVDHQAINKVSRYITRHSVGMDARALERLTARARRNIGRQRISFSDTLINERSLNITGCYFDGYDQEIWIRRQGFRGKINPKVMKEVANSTQRTMDAIERQHQIDKLPTSVISAKELERVWERTQNMSNSPNLTAKDVTTFIHELGHSVHHKTGYAKPPTQISAEWSRGMTEYGRTHDDEAFAEYFVAYVTAGKRLKRDYPGVHAFIDNVMNIAARHPRITQPPVKLNPRGTPLAGLG